MDSPVVITHIDKNANEKVRVALDTFHDVRLIDVRIPDQGKARARL